MFGLKELLDGDALCTPFKNLTPGVIRLRKGASMKEWIAVLKAADAAARWHVHQRRKGAAQEPYINHLSRLFTPRIGWIPSAAAFLPIPIIRTGHPSTPATRRK